MSNSYLGWLLGVAVLVLCQAPVEARGGGGFLRKLIIHDFDSKPSLDPWFEEAYPKMKLADELARRRDLATLAAFVKANAFLDGELSFRGKLYDGRATNRECRVDIRFERRGSGGFFAIAPLSGWTEASDLHTYPYRFSLAFDARGAVTGLVADPYLSQFARTEGKSRVKGFSPQAYTLHLSYWGFRGSYPLQLNFKPHSSSPQGLSFTSESLGCLGLKAEWLLLHL